MQRNLTIYYTSDSHGYFSPTDYASGERTDSGLSNCIANFKPDGNTLIIDGGDTMQGSPLTQYLASKGLAAEVSAKMMNLGGYNFVTLGNHDFNYGPGEIARYVRALDGECLCANVDGIEGVKKTAVVTLANGLRVGLTGITTHYVNLWEKPENLLGVHVGDAFTAAREALAALRAAGAEVTICIYHGGYEQDPVKGTPLTAGDENQGVRICRELGYDLLLCAHQHMAAENLCIGGTYTCEPPDRARVYAKIDAALDNDGRFTAHSRLLPAGSAEKKEAADYLAPFERETAEWLDMPVGELDAPLIPADNLSMAANGSGIANFFNQVQLEASGADISAASLDNRVKGLGRDVTIRDIVSSYTFPNTLKIIEVDRAVLKAALERSCAYFALDGAGKLCVSESFNRPIEQFFNFDFISGLRVTADVRRPVGDRVLSIIYEGEELTEGRKLSLCLNSYRATGAGGYGAYAACRRLGGRETEISELIIDYVRRHRRIAVDKTKWLNIIY